MKIKMTLKFLETTWSGIKYCLFSKRKISELDLIKPHYIYQQGIGNIIRSSLLSLLFFFSFSNAFTQVVNSDLPNEKRCTSKDLELVGASVINQGECLSCIAGDPVVRTLILSIKNSTGSNRTSFAFWGILDRYDGNTLALSTIISGCNSTPLPGNTSAVPPNQITDLPFDQIAYRCGQRLVIRNLYLAWTSAADNASCPLLPSKIAPKCGTLPAIEINAGVNGNVTSANASCTTGGTITVTPFGGVPPYSVKVGNGTAVNVAAGGSTTFNNGGSGFAAGDYNVSITDSTQPTNCVANKPVTVGGPPPLGKPAATVTQPTCLTATGIVTVTSPVTNVIYTLKQLDVLKYTAVSGVFSSVIPGTYQFIATLGICSTPGDPIIVNSQPGTPNPPSLKITEPSLCGPATGSLEVCNPITGNTYKIVGGATLVASGSPVIFQDLAAGSNPSITVTNAAGCTSSPANCSTATKDPCPVQGLTGGQTSKISSEKVTVDKTEKAGFTVFPVPFKDQLTVRYNFDSSSQVLIEVFNSQGNKVLTKKDSNGYLNKEVQLNLNSKTGNNDVYFVKVTTDKGNSIQKIISSR